MSPLYGHAVLARRLLDAARGGRLPASLLLHGPAGIGKQRLALHLAQALLCERDDAPCDECRACRYVRDQTHPDVHWYFPRPRAKDSDPAPEEVEAEYAEARAERARGGGLYSPASGSDGLHVATVRAMLHAAGRAPAMARRKIFVVGDAERMVPQEGSDQAANAFLKLLEEPPADTTLVLTSSEPGALLPTIRSRVAAIRVAPLTDAEVADFLADAGVRSRVPAAARMSADQLRLLAGRPGRLLANDEQADGWAAAERMLAAAAGGSRAALVRAAATLGSAKARGGFTAALDASGVQLHAHVVAAVRAGRDEEAVRQASAMTAIDEARERARGNVNPQLAGYALLRALRAALR